MGVFAAQSNAPDRWLEGDALFPRSSPSTAPETNRFASLHAEAVSEQFQVVYSPTSAVANSDLHVVFSADEPGHWPARDWHSLAMRQFGTAWKATVPVNSVDVPLVYFIERRGVETTNRSAMRCALPRALGLSQPSKYFWTFIDGFEQGAESWRILGGGERVRLSALAKNGKAALSVRIPATRNSITVGTTRLRGWFAEENKARGFAFWARTIGGAGEARCSLLAEALTTNQVLMAQTNVAKLTANWRRVEVHFSEFPKFPLGDLDLVAIEFNGPAGMEFLIDDLSLLGRWVFE